MVSWRRAGWVTLALVCGLFLLAGATLALPAMARPPVTVGRGPASAGPRLVINEVAWSGTVASVTDEWIELYNPGDVPVDLDGWSLDVVNSGSVIPLRGVVAPGGFYLIEAGDDSVISDIPADLIADFYPVPDSGDTLRLLDPAGQLVDTANGDGGPWPGGTPLAPLLSMERIDPNAPDQDENWGSNDGVIRNGLDALRHDINGTPKAWNSAGVTADLAIEKRGPFATTPGTLLTYTLTFSNIGALTATDVTIVDSLPTDVEYIRSSAPYTLTEPGPGILVWEVGRMDPGSGPAAFSLTIRLAPVWTGTMTNTAVISSSTVERRWVDNETAWAVQVDDSGPFVDLVIDKRGPARVATGEEFTYTLELANRGEVTATGVVVTDELPAGVTVLSESSPFTVTRPAPDLLRWDVGAVPAGGQPQSWILVGRVSDSLSGTLTNRALVSSWTSEANPVDNQASVTTVAVCTPTVRLTAVHYAALEGNDEAVQVTNLTGVDIDIGGWTVSDGTTAVAFPTSTTLAGHQSAWVTVEGAAFRSQFGFTPDFERIDSDPEIPNLTGSWPGFANAGDEVVLCDGSGVVQDVLVYKAGNALREGWVGPALWPYERGGMVEAGQILYRKLDEATSWPVRDTDTAADWAQDAGDAASGRKVRYPGWDLEALFEPLQITETARLTIVVGPDSIYPEMVEAVTRANQSLLIAGTRLESTGLAQAVAARASAGVSVTLLLEGDPDGGISDQERWVCQEVEAAGGECLLMIDAPELAIWDRYAEQAAQLVLIDERWALVGSASMSTASMPEDEKGNGTAGARSVLLMTNAPSVVSRLATLFALDADPTHHRDIAPSGSIGPPPDGYQPITAPDWTTYTVQYSVPLVLESEMAFEVVQAPENSLRERDALLGLLERAGAGDTVLVEQAIEPMHWGDPDSNAAEDPNLRLEAYLAAAERGARVRVLLDGDGHDPDRLAENLATCQYVEERAAAGALPIRCTLANPTGLGIENKMVLVQIDGQGTVHVGSIAGGERANKESRGVALQVQSDAAYAYLAAVYERDWPHPVYMPVVMERYPGMADYPLLSEVLYDPIGLDEGLEWIELTNPTAKSIDLAGWMIGDAAEMIDREGMYLLPAGAAAGPHGTLVIATNGAQFAARYGLEPDYELVDTLAAVPDLIPHPTWGRGDLILSNTGDEVALLDGDGRPVDVVVWGEGSYPGVVPHPGGMGEGRSLERYPRWHDSDDCSVDLRVQESPSPGRVP
jgi:cardiolipin synthase